MPKKYKPVRCPEIQLDGSGVFIEQENQDIVLRLDSDSPPKEVIFPTQVVELAKLESHYLAFYKVTYDANKKKATYWIKQKRDLSNFTSECLFLGNIEVLSRECVYKMCVYFRKVTHPKRITVVNPSNNLIKLNHKQELEVVVSHELISPNLFSIKNPNHSTCYATSGWGFYATSGNIRLISKDCDVSRQHTICINQDNNQSDLQCVLLCDGNTNLKIVGKNFINKNLFTMATSYLEVMCVHNETKNRMQQNESTIGLNTRHKQDGLLINPTVMDTVTINPNTRKLIVEIVPPYLYFDGLREDVFWEVSLEHPYRLNFSYLESSEIKDSYGQLHKVQKFEFSVPSSFTASSNGELELSLVTFWYKRFERDAKKITVNILLGKKFTSSTESFDDRVKWAQSYSKKSSSVYSGVERNIFVIDELEPFKGVKCTKVKTTFAPKQVSPTVYNSPNVKIQPTVNGEYLDIDLNKTGELKIKLVSGQLIRATGFVDANCENLWTYNILQHHAVMNILSSKIEKCQDGRIKQVFIFETKNLYLAKIVKPMYVGGIYFELGDKTRNYNKRILCYVDGVGPLTVKPQISAKLYLLDRRHGMAESPQVAFSRMEDGTKVMTVNKWSHNQGLIINPMWFTRISLPSLGQSHWRTKVAQYPLPEDVLESYGISLADNDFPWIPDDSYSSENGDLLCLSPILEFQEKSYEIVNVLKGLTKTDTVPIGKLLFKSRILKHSSQIEGSLIKSNEILFRRLYLYLENMEDKKEHTLNSTITVQNPKDFQVVTISVGDVLSVYALSTLYLTMMPPWLTLAYTKLITSYMREYVFVTQKDMINNDYNFHDGWIVFSGEPEGFTLNMILNS